MSMERKVRGSAQYGYEHCYDSRKSVFHSTDISRYALKGAQISDRSNSEVTPSPSMRFSVPVLLSPCLLVGFPQGIVHVEDHPAALVLLHMAIPRPDSVRSGVVISKS